MATRFNPPSTWPVPPEGWSPPAGWQPDPSWGPAPPGWPLWVDDEQTPRRGRRRALAAAAVGVAVAGAVALLHAIGATSTTEPSVIGPSRAATDASGTPASPCPSTGTSCSTRRYGSDLGAAEEWLTGLDRGAGGLLQKTAGPGGLVGGEVGSPRPMAAASTDLQLDELVRRERSCAVYRDAPHQVAVVTDAEDAVAAYVIANEVVETPEELRVGASLDDLRATYAELQVEQAGDGGWFALTAPQRRWDDVADQEYDASMAFWVGSDERVQLWAVGRTEYVTSADLCPEAGS
ncbi:hypothetical protein SAMN04488570_1704 [Nocardioides scoriae]|uniref:Uncharacterized protein n=1 Tax=Nocardioides scoriae TaxID=642780 RepID=A0A1H1RJF8_9ACTN|nr:hypothetical protein SAMN04488570_1704 [Nocardioides scoriae]